MDYIKNQQEQILSALAKYKFLTVRQMVKLGISTEQYLRVNLRLLREKKLIDRQIQGIQSRLGKSEDMHFLTLRGARVIAEYLDLELSEIHFPKSTATLFQHDYFHRVATINTKISFYQWAEKQGYEVDFFHTYYDIVGSVKSKDERLRAKTFLQLSENQQITPDCIFRYKQKNGNSFLYCVEVYNGNSTKRVYEQLLKLINSTFQGLASTKYNHSKGNRNLVICENQNAMQAVIDRIANSEEYRRFEGFERFLYFTTIEAVQSDFGALWNDIRGNKINLADF